MSKQDLPTCIWLVGWIWGGESSVQDIATDPENCENGDSIIKIEHDEIYRRGSYTK